MRKTEKKRRPQRYRNTAKLIIFTVISIITIILCAVGACIIKDYRPKVNDGTPSFIELTPSVIEATPESGEELIAADHTPEDINENNAAPEYTRTRKDTYNFLLVGKDNAGANTDIIIIVNFDIPSNRITMLQIPRDTYVEIGSYAYKINVAYSKYLSQAKKNGSKDPEPEGMAGLASLIEQNMAIELDYWIFCKLEGLREIVDIIGGVEVDVPFNMYYTDTEQDLYIDISAGKQILDGEHVEQFIRYRSGYIEGDIGRIDAQKIFYNAMLKQLRASFTVGMIPALSEQAFKHMNTSMTLADLIFFAKHVMNVDTSSLLMITLPGESARADGESGTWYYILKRADTMAVINKYFNVYDKDITESVFDPMLIFTAQSKTALNKIYRSDISSDFSSNIIDGSIIDSEGISIGLLQ